MLLSPVGIPAPGNTSSRWTTTTTTCFDMAAKETKRPEPCLLDERVVPLERSDSPAGQRKVASRLKVNKSSTPLHPHYSGANSTAPRSVFIVLIRGSLVRWNVTRHTQDHNDQRHIVCPNPQISRTCLTGLPGDRVLAGSCVPCGLQDKNMQERCPETHRRDPGVRCSLQGRNGLELCVVRGA